MQTTVLARHLSSHALVILYCLHSQVRQPHLVSKMALETGIDQRLDSAAQILAIWSCFSCLKV